VVANPQLGLIVRIFPGYTPSTYRNETPGTEITSYVRLEEGISFNRGAADETSFPSAGRLTMTLNNRDYRFTPDNTSSTYFPNFKNKMPIRIERTVSSFSITAITKSGDSAILTSASFSVADGWVTITGASAANNGTWAIVTQGAGTITVNNAAAVTQASVTATGSYTTALFTGFLETIEEKWNGGQQATVTITASDFLAVWARQKLLDTTTAQQKADGAIALYSLNSETGAVSATDASGNGYGALRRLTYGTTTTATVQAQTFNVGSFGSDPEDNVLQMTRHSSTIGYYMAANTQIASSATGTLEGYFYLSGGAMNGVLMRIESGANGYAVHANSPSTFVTTVLSTGTSTTQITGTSTIEDYQWHHIALTWSNVGSTTTWTLYVDGTSQGTYAESIASGPAVLRLFVGGADSATPATCWAANVAVYGTALTTDVIADHALATTGFVEATYLRFRRLIYALAGITYYSDYGSGVTMGAQPTRGQTVLDILQQINDVEDGAIYLDHNSTLQLEPQYLRDTLGTVVTINPKYLNTGTTLMRAPASVNTVIASRANGGSVTASDSVSVAENGVLSESISLYAISDADLQRVAKRRLYRRSTQQSRIGNVEVDLVTSPAINDNLLGAEISDYLSIGPFARGNVDTLLVRIEGISDQITPSSWVRTFVTSPAYVSKSGSNWVLGTSILDFTTTIT